MEQAPDTLIAQLASGQPAPLYLIAGAEPLRVIEASDAVRNAARRLGCTERTVYEITGTATRDKADSDKATVWTEIANTLGAPSLFSPLRLIEIRIPSGRPGTEGAKFLESIARDPVPGVIVMVIADDWSKKHGGKWADAFKANGVQCICWPVKSHELPNWLGTRLRNAGLDLDLDAIRIIAERVDGNLLAAKNEVDKLSLLTGGVRTQLDAEQTRALVADLARFDVFRLLESAWNGNGAQAIRMLEGLRQEGAAVPALMGMLVIELSTTADLAEGQAKGGKLDQLFRQRGVWESKQALYRRALQRHPAARWQRFLIEAGRVDRASKGREHGDAWVHLQRLITAIAAPGAGGLLATQMPSASQVSQAGRGAA